MIVYCEECGAKNELTDVDQISSDNPVRCRFCNDFLVINHQLASGEQSGSKGPAILSRLTVKFQDIQIEHKGPEHQITMGRRPSNDIRIQEERVSRHHAAIVYKQGKYCLIDKSLNGTYVLLRNRHGRILKHNEIMLVSEGIIGLGGIVDQDSPNAIHFSIQSL